jgi:hypothetical protein
MADQRAFVSSTFGDLEDVRREVREGLRRVGYVDVAMESMPAADARPVDECLRLVRSADVYIGIVAWRYGFVPPGHDRAITELEYRAARETGKPCLIVLLSERAPWPVAWIDPDRARVTAFRTTLAQAHTVSFFSNAADAVARVYEALHHLEKSRGIESPLVEAERAFAEALDLVAERQARHHRAVRLFDFGRDIRIEDVYVQEILQKKSERSPLDDFGVESKGETVPEKALLGKLAEERQTPVYVVEGRAGAGKSTMLKSWMLALLAARDSAPMFPLLVALRYLRGTSVDALAEAIGRTTPGIAPEQLLPLFDAGAPRVRDRGPAMLLLFDGLDEMAGADRKPFIDALGTLVGPGKGVLSTRPGVLEAIGTTPVRSRSFELCDFNASQIEQFVRQWFGADPAKADALLGAVSAHGRLRDVAAIPILLTCLAMHVELNGAAALSGGIGEAALLEQAVGILAERWDATRDGRPADHDYIGLCFDVFTELASWPRHVDVPWKDFLAIARRRAGPSGDAVARRIVQNGRVVAGDERGGVHFSHAIFFDFFFARHLAASAAP